MPLSSADFATAQRHMQVIETANNFDPTVVRGLIITVAATSASGAPHTQPLQVFVPVNDPNYAPILDLVQNITAANVSAAQTALSGLGLATAAGVTVSVPPDETVLSSPVIGPTPITPGAVSG